MSERLGLRSAPDRRLSSGASAMELLSDHESSDVISQILRAIRIRSTVYCRSVMGAPWGFGVKAHGNPAFHLVTSGRCWLEVEGETEQRALWRRGPGRVADRPQALDSRRAGLAGRRAG
jgi:hypothetical protein